MSNQMTALENIHSGENARLIPVMADTSKEGRATSILLACLAAIPEFSKVVFHSINQRVSKTSSIECLTEVVFKGGDGKKSRPDGIIEIQTGKKYWSCFIEAKIGATKLDKEQVTKYIDLAKANNVNAIITISNQFAAIPSHHPVKISRRYTQSFKIYHWSWQFLVTQAMVVLVEDDFIDSEKRYLLREMIRFFTHPSSGVRSFERMNSEWREVVLNMRRRTKYAANAPEIENVVGAWHQKQRDLSLQLTRRLVTPVSVYISRAHADDAEQRLRDDIDRLLATNKLDVIFQIPDAAASIKVLVDIDTRLVTCFMELQAPGDKQSTKARVNWLLRQLANSTETDVFIKGSWRRRPHAVQVSLERARENASCVDVVGVPSSVTSFDICMIRDFGAKFSGNKTFIQELEKFVPDFYENIGQHLNAWVPKPPPILAKDKVKAPPEPAPDKDRTLAWLAPVFGNRNSQEQSEE